MFVSRRLALLGAAGALILVAGCGASTFRTYYETPVGAEVSRGWRVVDVVVSVPDTLIVSEENSILPQADIVWREDPADGDRHDQVAVIMTTAARQGVSGLRGSRPVRLSLEVTRFHALTFEAENRFQNAGVHNIDFIAQITDARTGEVLAGPEKIEASLPALSGDQMKAARAQGQTQKSMITAHVSQTIAGWIGAGPDVRNSFARRGK
jgi:hypothetical protein